MGNILSLIILLSLLLPYCALSIKNCPQVCDCFGPIVDCSSNGLNQIPESLPLWVQELNLGKNPSLKFDNESFQNLPNLLTLSLDELDLTDFPNLGSLPKLTTLSLSGNALHRCPPDWARLMPRLSDLNLAKNKFLRLNISEISAPASPIERIDLKNNQISTVVPPPPPSTPSGPKLSFPSLKELRLPKNRIDDDAFRNLSLLFDALPNLKVLDLNRNLIRRPESLRFKSLTNLTVLKLKWNNIEDLPDGVFYNLTSLTTLRLDDNANITEISNGWLFEQRTLKILSLSHNNIGVIKDNAWETTKSLAVLNLSFNRLGCSNNEPSFRKLTNIQELFLSNNCLTNLDKDTFGELRKLQILDLSYNWLQRSIEDDTGAFVGLSALLSLNLAHNRIETIHARVLEPLTALTSLDLSGNQLKTLPDNPFRSMVHLSKLYFNSSSLVCDCRLAWLPEWLSTQSFNAVRSTCGFPSTLNATSIFRLRPADFTCDRSPQPLIAHFPRNQTALYGRNMTLECVAFTSGERTNFTWTKDRKVVEPFRVRTFMSVEVAEEGRTVYKVVSQFHVENVTHYHGGSYQCIARDPFGPSYSPPAEVTVHRFPYFTERPVSVEVKEGDVVELRCAASGFPAPEILVNKVDGVFRAPRENRLFYSNHVYFIKPVLPRDDGVYVCTARNAAGAVNITARVSVIYTPSFSRPLYNQVATLGQSIALECQGTGYPKPKVTWFKEDLAVSEDSNHVIVDNGQFLLLLKVSHSDIGSYRCELTNTLGTQRRKINLALRKDVLFPALTGVIVMIVVICVVLTSFLWLLILFRVRKRCSRGPGREDPLGGRGPGPGGLPASLSATLITNERLKENLTPLLTPHLGEVAGPTGAQDSGSEHSSGKDSGVGESAQRSSEDLQPNGDLLKAVPSSSSSSAASVRRSLLIYPDSPNGLALKGGSCSGLQSRAASEEIRPRLSTFGLQHLDAPHKPFNPTYASLRRGSASRLLPVPAPVTPGLGMNSLPRHAYRPHSNSLSAKMPPDRCASLSRRRPSRPDTPPPSGVTDLDERNDFRPLGELGERPRHQGTYYTFRNPDRPPKKNLTGSVVNGSVCTVKNFPNSAVNGPGSVMKNLPSTAVHLPTTVKNLPGSAVPTHLLPTR